MDNSEAYKRFIKQLKSIGAAKKDGYDPRTIDLLYKWERSEIEDIIWDYFNNKNDYLLCTLMPRLEKYDGVKALQESPILDQIPSSGSAYISSVLYECTKDGKYLDIIKRDIDADPDNIEYVSILSYCNASDKLFELLKDVYLNNNNTVNRGIAVRGMLHIRGLMKAINDPVDIQNTKEIREKFKVNTKEEREKILDSFLSGELF